MNKNFLIVGGLALIIIVWGVVSYNGLATSKRAIDGAWGQVQVVLQRRMDLVEQQVGTIKGQTAFEKSTLLAIANARAGIVTAEASGDKEKQIAAAKQVDNVMYQFRVQVEQYPTLGSNASFTNFNTVIEGNENRISVERKRYNDAVLAYNTQLVTFPRMLIARLFGFTAEKQYAADAAAQAAPKIDFGTK